MLFKKIPSSETFTMASKFYVSQQCSNPPYPTDEEVLAMREVFHFLLDLAAAMRQDMLSMWASAQYQTFNNIAYSRKLV